MNFLSIILAAAGPLVVAVILFRAWRRFPGRESRLALIGALLILGGTLLSLAIVLILLDLNSSPGDSGSRLRLGTAVAILRLPGLVGMVLLAYAYWVVVIGRRDIQPPLRSDDVQ